MTESEKDPDRPTSKYTRDSVRKFLEQQAKEDPDVFRNLGENAVRFSDTYGPKFPRSPLQDFLAKAPAPELMDFDWEEGQSPYDLSRANRDASEATADLLRQMIASNAATAKSNRRATWINITLAALSCAAAVFAAIVAL
ncbi:hypothetical protein ITJ58_11740 [Curtobacterium flaccumfaciens]|uniref:hypothetical protein n=1 Tax=Curtobacterium flaccumfaciens TaxID=2035 RepID=UPI00188AC921|nr:hypothetical protein [Curtobacterium flaccumfaciens]MBF4594423.1 hypothetical protein [Curtobacterium flaccumfaciens]